MFYSRSNLPCFFCLFQILSFIFLCHLISLSDMKRFKFPDIGLQDMYCPQPLFYRKGKGILHLVGPFFCPDVQKPTVFLFNRCIIIPDFHLDRLFCPSIPFNGNLFLFLMNFSVKQDQFRPIGKVKMEYLSIQSRENINSTEIKLLYYGKYSYGVGEYQLPGALSQNSDRAQLHTAVGVWHPPPRVSASCRPSRPSPQNRFQNKKA